MRKLLKWDCEDMLCNSVSTGCLCWTDCSCHDLDLRQYRGSHINFLLSPGRDMKVPLPKNKMPGTCCSHPYVPNYWTPNTFTSSLPWVGTVFSMDSCNPGLWSLDPNVGSWQRLQISTAAFSKPWSAPAVFWCRYLTGGFFSLSLIWLTPQILTFYALHRPFVPGT